MVPNTTNNNDQLSPDRHPQHDLFICDVADAILKDILPCMEHPFYSLSKKPETSIRRYEHNGNWLEVTPSVKGLATIYDKDILIYCISQIMAKLNRGEQVSRRVRINSREMLQFTNRGTSGRDYKALCEALDRLGGTRIATNIRLNEEEEEYSTFGLIDGATIRRKHGLDGRMLWCEVQIADWIFDVIRDKEVLTLHRDYFRLRRPIERRLYELGRKHCGRQAEWSCTLKLLHKKSGSKANLREFRRAVRYVVQHDHLPDYHIRFDGEVDKVTFINRGELVAPSTKQVWEGFLSGDDYDAARGSAGGWDIYQLESRWRAWLAEKDIIPKAPGPHFRKFCASWVENNGSAGGYRH